MIFSLAKTRVVAVVAILLASVCPPSAVAAQSCPDAAQLTRGLTLPMAAVRFLADDALEGRLAGSPGERCAGDYIAATFARLGLSPAGEASGFFQVLPLASALNPHAPAGDGRNVIAILPGSDPVLRDEYLVIGAHYDHLGLGEFFGSLAPDEVGQPHNGADDNASGVGAMLRIAERLSQGPRPARSVLFIAFTGEESGLLGSAFFVAHPTVPRERMIGMINLDMVGRLGTNPLIVNGVDTADEWRPVLTAAADAEGVTLAMGSEGYGPSDHSSFYGRDIPVLHFFTNVHGDYHKPSDDWEKIDGDGIEKVAAVITDVVDDVARPTATLTLVRGMGAPPGQSTDAGYGAWLGSVPDFTPVERGVRLSGITTGSPAQIGGLQPGDVIVGFDDMEIADLQGLTDALRAHKPGDVVQVHVLREGEEHQFEVTLGDRAARGG